MSGNGARNIPEKYWDEIITMHAEGTDGETITVHLQKDYNVNCSRDNVYRVIRNARKEKQEATQKIYAEAAEKHAFKDLDIINRAIDHLNKSYQLSLGKDKVLEAVKSLDIMLKFISKRMELSGLGRITQEEEGYIEDARAALIKRFNNTNGSN